MDRGPPRPPDLMLRLQPVRSPTGRVPGGTVGQSRTDQGLARGILPDGAGGPVRAVLRCDRGPRKGQGHRDAEGRGGPPWGRGPWPYSLGVGGGQPGSGPLAPRKGRRQKLPLEMPPAPGTRVHTHTHPGSAEAPSRVPYDRPSCASLSGSGLPPHHTGLPPWWPGSARGPLHSSVHASPTLTGQGTSAWVTLAFLLNPPQTPGSLPPPSPPRTEGVPSALHASAGAPPRPWGPSQTCPHPQAERQSGRAWAAAKSEETAGQEEGPRRGGGRGRGGASSRGSRAGGEPVAVVAGGGARSIQPGEPAAQQLSKHRPGQSFGRRPPVGLECPRLRPPGQGPGLLPWGSCPVGPPFLPPPSAGALGCPAGPRC